MPWPSATSALGWPRCWPIISARMEAMLRGRGGRAGRNERDRPDHRQERASSSCTAAPAERTIDELAELGIKMTSPKAKVAAGGGHRPVGRQDAGRDRHTGKLPARRDRRADHATRRPGGQQRLEKDRLRRGRCEGGQQARQSRKAGRESAGRNGLQQIDRPVRLSPGGRMLAVRARASPLREGRGLCRLTVNFVEVRETQSRANTFSSSSFAATSLPWATVFTSLSTCRDLAVLADVKRPALGHGALIVHDAISFSNRLVGIAEDRKVERQRVARIPCCIPACQCWR